MIRFVTTLLAAFAATLGGGQRAIRALVKRGDYLVNGLLTCGNCHTPKGPTGDIMEKAFSGGLSCDEPPFKVTAPNITPDKETGIGNCTDAQHQDGAAQRHQGERHTGRDGHAERFLRDHDRSRPRRGRRLSAHASSRSRTRWPIRSTRCRRGIRSRPAARSHTRKPMMTDKLKKGFYLVTIAHCLECHTPMGPRGRDFADQARHRRLRVHRARGACRCRATSPRARPRASAPGPTPRSSALSRTASARTAASSSRRWRFHSYATMTADDLDAVVAYLRTVPAKE